jgi:ribosomal protein S18 acetylase RimI-like enzyme
VEIRHATLEDGPALRAMWDASSEETAYTPYPGAVFEEAFLRQFVALVAQEAGELAGCVYANTASPSFGFVFGLYVRPEHRRRGVARALMQAIAATLHDQGREYVVLSVDTPNDAARALYDDLGFVDAARTLRARAADLLA